LPGPTNLLRQTYNCKAQDVQECLIAKRDNAGKRNFKETAPPSPSKTRGRLELFMRVLALFFSALCDKDPFAPSPHHTLKQFAFQGFIILQSQARIAYSELFKIEKMCG
jgi:hypothetical protein